MGRDAFTRFEDGDKVAFKGEDGWVVLEVKRYKLFEPYYWIKNEETRQVVAAKHKNLSQPSWKKK